MLVMIVVAVIGVIVITHVYQASQRVNNPPAPTQNVCNYSGGQTITLPGGTDCPAVLP